MATPRKKNPKKAGRKASFKPEFVDLARKFCLLGAIDTQLAEFFGVQEKTINNWKKKYPEFLQALRAGKEQADAEIANSLYHRAKGYTHPEVDLKLFKGKIIKTEITKHYPPDTKAIVFWMTNRRRPDKVEGGDWSERQEFDHTTKGDKIAMPQVYLPQDLSREEVEQSAQPGQSA